METKTETKTNATSDVLHSNNSSKLSADEIARAVARGSNVRPVPSRALRVNIAVSFVELRPERIPGATTACRGTFE
jgi:hypothetical protein